MTSVNEPLRGGPLPGVPYQNAAYLAERYGPAYRWLVTITGMVGVVSMVLAMTTVNVAVPDVMGAFGIGQDKAQWMSSAYMATMTAGMLLNAWMSGVLGERRTFIGALFFFSAGALLGGMAPNEDVLIFARILQGFSAGIAQPLVMATIFTVFPAERRGSAMGIFGLGVVFAPAIGPTLGGLMIEYFSWRYVFYISLPFCGIAALMGAFFMPTRPLAREIPPFDWLGFALLCVGLWGLMTGIADGQREGWSSDVIVLHLVLGTAAAVGFVLWELYTPRALLDMRIFANLEFASAAVIAFICGAGMMGLGFINPSLNATALKALPADKVRQGAGVANFMRQLGGAFGINLIVAFFEVRTRFHADALTATQDWGNRTTERLLFQMEQLMQRSGLPFQQQKAAALEFLGQMVNAQAQMLAFSDTFIVIAIVALLALIPAALLSRSQQKSPMTHLALGRR